MAKAEKIGEPRFAKRLSPRGQDSSSFVIAVDHEACILCDRCIRGCDEIRHNDVLGRRGKGYNAGIAFDLSFESPGLYGLALVAALADRLDVLTVYWAVGGFVWFCCRATTYCRRMA